MTELIFLRAILAKMHENKWPWAGALAAAHQHWHRIKGTNLSPESEVEVIADRITKDPIFRRNHEQKR